MSKKFTRENMICGNVYRLIGGCTPEYIGKLFIATSTNFLCGGRACADQAACLEDGFALNGLLDGAEFEEAEAKIIDLS